MRIASAFKLVSVFLVVLLNYGLIWFFSTLSKNTEPSMFLMAFSGSFLGVFGCLLFCILVNLVKDQKYYEVVTGLALSISAFLGIYLLFPINADIKLLQALGGAVVGIFMLAPALMYLGTLIYQIPMVWILIRHKYVVVYKTKSKWLVRTTSFKYLKYNYEEMHSEVPQGALFGLYSDRKMFNSCSSALLVCKQLNLNYMVL